GEFPNREKIRCCKISAGGHALLLWGRLTSKHDVAISGSCCSLLSAVSAAHRSTRFHVDKQVLFKRRHSISGRCSRPRQFSSPGKRRKNKWYRHDDAENCGTEGFPHTSARCLS